LAKLHGPTRAYLTLRCFERRSNGSWTGRLHVHSGMQTVLWKVAMFPIGRNTPASSLHDSTALDFEDRPGRQNSDGVQPDSNGHIENGFHGKQAGEFNWREIKARAAKLTGSRAKTQPSADFASLMERARLALIPYQGAFSNQPPSRKKDLRKVQEWLEARHQAKELKREEDYGSALKPLAGAFVPEGSTRGVAPPRNGCFPNHFNMSEGSHQYLAYAFDWRTARWERHGMIRQLRVTAPRPFGRFRLRATPCSRPGCRGEYGFVGTFAHG
jgi:hypothetical protein